MTAVDPSMNGQAQPTFPDGTVPVDSEMVKNAVLNALHQAATGAASSTHSAAEAKDYATAVRELAQAIVILDPSLSQGGTPLEHDLMLKGMEHDSNERIATIHAAADVEKETVRGEFNHKAAQEAAKAPTPARSAVANA